MSYNLQSDQVHHVALFTRAWIEIKEQNLELKFGYVALFTRAWIEIENKSDKLIIYTCRPLHEGVD